MPTMNEKRVRKKKKSAELDGVSLSAGSRSSAEGATNILKFMGCATKFMKLTVHDPASAMTDRIVSNVATEGRRQAAPVFEVPAQFLMRPPPPKNMTMEFFEARLNVNVGEYIKTEKDFGLATGQGVVRLLKPK